MAVRCCSWTEWCGRCIATLPSDRSTWRRTRSIRCRFLSAISIIPLQPAAACKWMSPAAIFLAVSATPTAATRYWQTTRRRTSISPPMRYTIGKGNHRSSCSRCCLSHHEGRAIKHDAQRSRCPAQAETTESMRLATSSCCKKNVKKGDFAMSAKGFSHIGLSTLALDKTRNFYENVLGFKPVRCDIIKVKEGGRIRHVFFDTGRDQLIAF